MRTKLPVRETIRWVCLALLVLALVYTAVLAWHGLSLYRLASDSMKSQITGSKAQILETLPQASSHLEAMRGLLVPLYPLFQFMGGPFSQIQPWLDTGTYLCRAGNRLSENFRPALLEMLKQDKEVKLEDLAVLYVTQKPGVEEAISDLRQAAQAQKGIQAELVPGFLKHYYTQYGRYLQWIGAGADLLEAAPALMGIEQPRTYLVLAQNREELRATGGFISGIGIIRVQQGKVVNFRMSDSYAVDDLTKRYPRPPEPIQRFMLADYWTARDANWSPDFPSAATQVQSLYKLSTGQDTQGVIAFDQTAIRQLTAILGPFQLKSTGKPVTGENVEQYMTESWQPEAGQKLNQDWWLHRKDFMGELGTALVLRAEKTRDLAQILTLLRTVNQLIQEGHLSVYLNNQDETRLLNRFGWNHRVQPGQGDYLQVVDSNIGFNKVDTSVKRELAYEVDLRGVVPEAKLTMKYEHTAKDPVECKHAAYYGGGQYSEMESRCYWDYWRVYKPAGTQLIESKVKPVSGKQLLTGKDWAGPVDQTAGENGSLSFGGLLVMPPANQAGFALTLGLPTSVVHEGPSGSKFYLLRIQKQSGLDNLPVILRILLPNGAQLLQADKSFTQDENAWVWNGSIQSSQDFLIAYTSAH